MKTLLRNYRDVGASLSVLSEKEENDDNQLYSVIPPGMLLRSSAWDMRPDITWEDIGRPNTIINLRQHRDMACYEQLQSKNTEGGDNDDERCVNTPRVWHISADNNTEKYDLSLPESRDWLISVLRQLLQDVDEKDTSSVELEADASSKDLVDLTRMFPSVSHVPASLKDDEECDERRKETCHHGQTSSSIFRIALAIVLRRRLTIHHSPLLVHCRFGRDRTGIVVAFILKLLIPSIPDTLLKQEFLLSDLSCNDDPIAKNEMLHKGRMFSELTLQNLPFIFDYIESRKRQILSGDNYKATRLELFNVVSSLKSLQQTPFIGQSPYGFKLDYDYVKEEAKRHFKGTKVLLAATSMNMGIDERYHILWNSLAYHFSVQRWLQMMHNDVDAYRREEETLSSKDAIEHQLSQIRRLAVATQIAMVLLESNEDEPKYPIPHSMSSIQKVTDLQQEIQNDLDDLEKRMTEADGDIAMNQRLVYLKKCLNK